MLSYISPFFLFFFFSIAVFVRSCGVGGGVGVGGGGEDKRFIGAQPFSGKIFLMTCQPHIYSNPSNDEGSVGYQCKAQVIIPKFENNSI